MIAKKLQKHDTIGIIAPAYVVYEGQYQEAIGTLEQMHFKVKLSRNLFQQTHGYAATEQERAEDFDAMIADPDVKMLLFGGGYVSNEILPFIDFENIRDHPKFLVSYSDGTTLLNAVYTRTGLVTYYGQKPSTFAQLSPYNRRQFAAHFIEDSPRIFEKRSSWRTLCAGSGEGILIGGYLENLALLLGGKYFSYQPQQKYLLFLEDFHEYSQPARISMYLSHLEQSDFIHTVTGLVFGHYAEYECPELLRRLERFGNSHQIPVVICDDFGHGLNNGIFPIGWSAKLQTDPTELIFDG